MIMMSPCCRVQVRTNTTTESCLSVLWWLSPKVTDCACSRGVWVMWQMQKSALDMKMQSGKWNHDPAATAASRICLRLATGHNKRRWHSSSLCMVILVVSLCTAVYPHKFYTNASFHWYVETRNAACHKHHKLRKTFCKIMWEKCGVLICLRNVRIPWARKVQLIYENT